MKNLLEKLLIPIKFPIQVTRAQHPVYISQFCNFLPFYSHKTTTDQTTVNQSLLTKLKIFYIHNKNVTAMFQIWSKIHSQKMLS